jgi:hypothetical protein
MISPGKLLLNSFRKAFSEVRKSTMQTPLSVDATNTFFNNGDLKEE